MLEYEIKTRIRIVASAFFASSAVQSVNGPHWRSDQLNVTGPQGESQTGQRPNSAETQVTGALGKLSRQGTEIIGLSIRRALPVETSSVSVCVCVCVYILAVGLMH